MKIKKSFWALALGGVITFASCNKDESSSSETQLKSTTSLNYFGISHNAKLDYVGNNTSDLENSTTSERLETADGYIDPVFGDLNGTTLSQSNAGIVYTDDIYADLLNAGNTLSSDNYIDDNFSSYYNNLGQLFQDALDSVSAQVDYTPQYFSVQVDLIISEIETNHDVTLDESNWSGSEATKAIITLEIAKSSYSYWHDAASTGTTNPWSSFVDVNAKVQANFWERAWLSIRRAATDTWSFPSCPVCGRGDQQGGYDLRAAWDYAGDQSAAVD